ncbi:MAG: hypothetical protein WCA30_03020, partial [Dermatophilaceae bacterium]
MSTTPDRPDPSEPVTGHGSDEPHDTPNRFDDAGAPSDPAPGSAPLTEPISETTEQPDSAHTGSDQPESEPWEPADPGPQSPESAPAPPPLPSSFSPQAEAPAPPPPPM